MLLSIAVYYEKKPELVHRFNFQIMLILILIDIFWLLIIGFVWEHDEKDNRDLHKKQIIKGKLSEKQV